MNLGILALFFISDFGFRICFVIPDGPLPAALPHPDARFLTIDQLLALDLLSKATMPSQGDVLSQYCPYLGVDAWIQDGTLVPVRRS
ncbi:MAG: hypothetical protein P4N60_17625 [Verrucomicrobiae bacterium]|nr:hypothetical protein [Verrucomicrobiae bacterium]